VLYSNQDDVMLSRTLDKKIGNDELESPGVEAFTMPAICQLEEALEERVTKDRRVNDPKVEYLGPERRVKDRRKS